MTSSNENMFRGTGFLSGEFTGHRWIPLTKASVADLWCFFIWAWINAWVNIREAGDLRRHHARHDVTVMKSGYHNSQALNEWVNPYEFEEVFPWRAFAWFALVCAPMLHVFCKMVWNHQWRILAFIRGPFHRNIIKYLALIWLWKLLIQDYKCICQGQLIKHVCVRHSYTERL